MDEFERLCKRIAAVEARRLEMRLEQSAAEARLLRLVGAAEVGASLRGTDEATGFYPCDFAVRARELVIHERSIKVHYRGYSYPHSKPKQHTQRGRIRAHCWKTYTRKDVA